MFTAQFVITEKCNLNCEYCYMKKVNREMTKTDFDFHYHRNLPYFMAMFNEEKYRLDLFGGEPTLNWSLVEYITKKVKNDNRLERIQLMSNGILIDRKKVRFIKDNNIKFCFSFDGIYSDQKELYLKNKSYYKQLECTPNVCITPDTLDMKNNLKFFVEEFEITPFFKIVRDNIWSKDDIRRFSCELNFVFELYKKYLYDGIDAFPFQHYVNRFVESVFFNVEKKRCYVGRDGAAFAPDGRVYPCARFISEKNTPYFDGVYHDDNIDKMEKTAKEFRQECWDCEISSFCDHPCMEQEMKFGLFRNVCEIYKILYNGIIKINEELMNNYYWTNRIAETRRLYVRPN